MRGTQREIPAWFVVVLCALAIARAALELGALRFPSRDPAAAWLPYDEASRRAAERGVPLLVVFAADWCPPCKRFEHESLTDERVRDAIARGFEPTRVFDSTDPAQSTPGGRASIDRHGVTVFPTLVIVPPPPLEPVTRAGFMPPGDTLRFLEAARLRALAARNSQARQPPPPAPIPDRGH